METEVIKDNPSVEESIKEEKKGSEIVKTQFGIRTTSDIKAAFFNEVEGANADEKLRMLLKSYEELNLKNSINSQSFTFDITNNIDSIKDSFSSILTQIDAISGAVREKEKCLKHDYIDFIGKEIDAIGSNLKSIDKLELEKIELERAVEDLNTQNYLKDEQFAMINSKYVELEQVYNATIQENNNLLKKDKEHTDYIKGIETRLNSVISDLTYKNELLEKDNLLYSSKINDLQSEKLSIKDELDSERNSNKQEIKDLMAEHKNEVNEYRDIISNKDNSIKELEININKLNYELNAKDIEIENLKNQINKLNRVNN